MCEGFGRLARRLTDDIRQSCSLPHPVTFTQSGQGFYPIPDLGLPHPRFIRPNLRDALKTTGTLHKTTEHYTFV